MSFVLTPQYVTSMTPLGSHVSQRLLEEIAVWRNGEEGMCWGVQLVRRLATEVALPFVTVVLVVESVVRFVFGLIFSLFAAIMDPENECYEAIRLGTLESGAHALSVIPNALAALITNIYRRDV